MIQCEIKDMLKQIFGPKTPAHAVESPTRTVNTFDIELKMVHAIYSDLLIFFMI